MCDNHNRHEKRKGVKPRMEVEHGEVFGQNWLEKINIYEKEGGNSWKMDYDQILEEGSKE